MSILIPPAVNYPSPMITLNSRLLTVAPEGPRSIPCEILWASMGGAAHCVSFNVQNISQSAFSQIVSLKIDNSQCGSDIQFIFTDTSEVVTIPAYSPLVIVPVFTGQKQFFVVALGEEPVDITRFQLLNFVPPPIAVPTSQEQNNASANNVAITGSGAALQVIPLGVSGTLEDIQMSVAIVSATSAGASSFSLQDGSSPPKQLAWASVAGANAASFSANILSLSPAAIRFNNGVTLAQFGAWNPSGAAFLTYNILYRVP